MGDRVPAWIRRTELFAQIQVHATLQFVRGYTGAQSLGVFEDPFSHEVLHPGRYLVGVGVEDMAGFDGAVVVLSAKPDRTLEMDLAQGTQRFQVAVGPELVAPFLMSTQPLVS